MKIELKSRSHRIRCLERDLSTGWYYGRVRGLEMGLFYKAPVGVFIMDGQELQGGNISDEYVHALPVSIESITVVEKS